MKTYLNPCQETNIFFCYPPGVGPLPLISNAPESPVVSTLTPEKRLLSIEISRKYVDLRPSSTVYENLKNELNSKLGTSYTYGDAQKIYAQYGCAVMTTPLGAGQPPHLYTPESVKKCQSDYMEVLDAFKILAFYQLAARLDPFDANGNIKFKADKYTKFYNTDGTVIWPPEDGFYKGHRLRTEVKVGDIVDRYGPETGYFLSPEGVPIEMRSLKPGTAFGEHHKYLVRKPFSVDSGLAAPWFCQPGGGVQYQCDRAIEYLVKNKFLEEIY